MMVPMEVIGIVALISLIVLAMFLIKMMQISIWVLQMIKPAVKYMVRQGLNEWLALILATIVLLYIALCPWWVFGVAAHYVWTTF